MLIDIPESVIHEIRQINAVASWKNWDFQRIESNVDRAIYHASELVMAIVLKEVNKYPTLYRLTK